MALPAGHRLRAAIGDLDSLADPSALEAAGVAVHRVAEQDTTDLEKCLYSVTAPLYLGVGVLGGRIDHELAALNAVAKNPGKRVVLLGREDVCLRWPGKGMALDLAAGERVSLFPMGAARGLASEGLRWPVTDLDFAPGGRVGTSNIATGGPVRLEFAGGPVLMILPERRFEAVAAALGPGA